MGIKVDDVSINRQFLEANDDDAGKVYTLLFNAHYKAVFAKIDRMMRNHPDPAVDPRISHRKPLSKPSKRERPSENRKSCEGGCSL